MLASLRPKFEKMDCLFGENRLCTVSMGRVSSREIRQLSCLNVLFSIVLLIISAKRFQNIKSDKNDIIHFSPSLYL